MHRKSGVFQLYFDGMTQPWKTESGTDEYFTQFKHHKAIKGRNRMMVSDSQEDLRWLFEQKSYTLGRKEVPYELNLLFFSAERLKLEF